MKPICQPEQKENMIIDGRQRKESTCFVCVFVPVLAKYKRSYLGHITCPLDESIHIIIRGHLAPRMATQLQRKLAVTASTSIHSSVKLSPSTLSVWCRSLWEMVISQVQIILRNDCDVVMVMVMVMVMVQL